MAVNNYLPLSVGWENGTVSQMIQAGIQPKFIILACDVKLSLDELCLEVDDDSKQDEALSLFCKKISDILRVMSKLKISQSIMNQLAICATHWHKLRRQKAAQAAQLNK